MGPRGILLRSSSGGGCAICHHQRHQCGREAETEQEHDEHAHEYSRSASDSGSAGAGADAGAGSANGGGSTSGESSFAILGREESFGDGYTEYRMEMLRCQLLGLSPGEDPQYPFLESPRAI